MGYFFGPNVLELTIYDDNYARKNKNKNNIDIWYTLWLLEIGLFSHVNLLLFIRGHKIIMRTAFSIYRKLDIKREIFLHMNNY